MTNATFNSLSISHGKLSEGIFTKEIINVGGIEINKGFNPDDIYNSNFGIIAVDNPSKLNLKTAITELSKVNKDAGIYILPNDLENGFLEFFVRNGLKFENGDTWMLYDINTANISQPKHKITEVTLETFDDYYTVLSKVFGDFKGNEDYLELLKNLIGKKTNSKVEDLISKLFIIYDDNNKPAAGAGLFYSKSENLAYLHDGGTLEEYRGKGYQTSLINFRVNFAKELGINRMYSMVDQGEQSWSNLIKQGFKQLAQTYVFRSPIL